MSNQITLEVLKEALPDNLGKNASQNLVDKINSILTSDPGFAEQYAHNLFEYTNVLKTGKYKLSSYVEAVQFVSYLSMGMSNQDAWIKTFPDRYKYYISKGNDMKTISAYISMYSNSKLVSTIKEVAYIPIHIMYRHIQHEAIMTQVELMKTATSEKVRSDAANSLMTHLRPPETKKVELDIGIKQTNELTDLRRVLGELSAMQQQAIASGVQTAGQIAEGRIIEHDESE